MFTLRALYNRHLTFIYFQIAEGSFYHAEPDLNRDNYEKAINLISIFQKIDNELYSKMDKISSFNKIFTNNIIKAINNILEEKCENDHYDIYFKKLFIDISNYFNPGKIMYIK